MPSAGNVLTSLDELGSLAPNLTALDASHNLIERLNGVDNPPRILLMPLAYHEVKNGSAMARMRVFGNSPQNLGWKKMQPSWI